MAVVMVAAGCASSARTSASTSSSATTADPTTSPSSSPPGPSTTPRTVNVHDNRPNLGAVVLQVADMPAGWTTDIAPQITALSSGTCLQPVTVPPGHPQATAQVFYQTTSPERELEETVAAYPAPEVAAAFGALRTELSGCGALSVSRGATHVVGTLTELSSPGLGQESSAWRISFSGSATNLDGLLMVADTVDHTVAIVVLSTGPTDQSLAAQLAQRAVARAA
jgi:hypothetical protein